MRDSAVLYDVRRKFHHWRHNEFDSAGCEPYIDRLIAAIDELLVHLEDSQEAWDRALGGVNWLLYALSGFALVGADKPFHTFLGQQISALVDRGVLP
ncbi:hypothetical protein IAG25_33200 [Caballeronia sp. EK]|uniref:hypothetical protein n=1 Tax=Caballeronia sp. EK TaxID=2767469 RepID=UPI0016554604|nr:hypothetical protein [Caballeronia sp. EK]MBC8641685.1 hypothetical protein [Caballeronia sp. EK]